MIPIIGVVALLGPVAIRGCATASTIAHASGRVRAQRGSGGARPLNFCEYQSPELPLR
jgi:hypothetical protein